MTTNVSGPLRLVTDQPATLVQVMVRAPRPRPHSGGVVVDFTTPATLNAGTVSFPCVPGAAILSVARAGVPQVTIPLVVPDKSSATLEECIRAAQIADDIQRGQLESLARRVVEDADAAAKSAKAAADDRTSVAESKRAVDGYRVEAAGARDAAAASAAAAKTSEANAKTSETNAGASKDSAASSASDAAASKSAASKSAAEAAGSAEQAAGSASSANDALNTVSQKVSDAGAEADRAQEQADRAQEGAESATASAEAASTSAAAAKDSESAASVSAESAKVSEQKAASEADRAESAVTSTRWVGTQLEVNGKLSPDLRGPMGKIDGVEGVAKLITRDGTPPLEELVRVESLVAQNREGLTPSHPYSDPSAEQVAAMRAAVSAIMRGETPQAPEGTEIISGYDETARRNVVVLRSIPGNGLYWGMWVFPKDAKALGVVEAPHPVFDGGSDDIATRVWAGTQTPTVLAVAGSHRTNPDGTDQRDVAHNTESMWHQVTTHIAQPGLPELQLHGFGDSSMPGVGAVVSSGSSPLSAGVVRTEAYIAAAGITTARQWDGSATKLIGMANIQGDAAALRGNPFLHIELSKTVRDSPDALVRAVSSAGFLAGENSALLTNEYPKPIGSANSRGTAPTAARADHVHRLVQNDPTDGEVVVRQGGGWRSVDPKTIGAVPDNVSTAVTAVEGATYSATAGSLMKRTSTGAVSVADPTANVHAANKRYVDAAAASKADLVGGQVPTSQIPAVALTKPNVVSDRTAMLALTAEEGDVAVITTGADKGTYMLGTDAPTTFSSWIKLATPDGSVSSVNGQTGVVNLTAQEVGAAPSSHEHQARDVWDASGETVQSVLDSHELKVREIDGLQSAKLDKSDVSQDNAGGKVVRRQDDGHIISANYSSSQQVLDTLNSQPKAMASLWAAQQIATDVMGATTQLGSDVDLNTITTSGVYEQTTSTFATLAKNYPVNVSGILEVFSGKGAVSQQWVTKGTGQRFYRSGRFMTGGDVSWTGWYEAPTKEYVDNAVGQVEFYEFPYTSRLTTNTGGVALYWTKNHPNAAGTVAQIPIQRGLYEFTVTLAFDSYYGSRYNLKVINGGNTLAYDMGVSESSWDTIRTHSMIVNNLSGSYSNATVLFTGEVTAYLGINKSTGIRSQLLLKKLA